MTRLLFTRVLVAAVLLAALAGCSSDDSPSTPAGFDLADQFAADEAVVIANGASTTVRLIGLEFTSDTSATLAPSSLALLDKFAAVDAHYAGAQYAVQAHTDERGTAAANLTFSQQRAESVRDYLVGTVGLPAGTDATGYGEAQPLDPAHNAAAWAQNRRVEVVIRPAE